MSVRSATYFLASFVAACLGLAGCATTPTDNRSRMVGIPLATAHADIGFALTTGTRLRLTCGEGTPCQTQAEMADAAAARFAMQVARVADALQAGALGLYPDLPQHVPGMTENHFEVYVVEDAEPGSASSANGSIALNSALGIGQPYDDWLAFVIAREMGHIIARHHEENSAASIVTSVIMNLVIPGSSLLKSALSAGGSKMAAISQREVQALEADAFALILLDAAGFRQRDVALALRIAPAMSNDNLWARSFSTSADNFIDRSAEPAFLAWHDEVPP